MENKGEISKTELDVDEKEQDQASKREEKLPRRKNIKEKALTAALVGGLLTGSAGCNVGQNNNQEKTEPVMPDPIEETLDIDRDMEEIKSVDIPVQEEALSEESDVFELSVGELNLPQLNLHSNILKYVDSVHVTEGEVTKYPVFDTKEKQDHFENLAVFIDSLFDEDVNLDPAYIQWEVPGGEVIYGRGNNFLTLNFETPKSIPGVQINPESKESIQEGLKEITSRIVDDGFEHKIDQIIKEGDYYKVQFRRLLNGTPVYTKDYQPYLILSPEGKLKEGGIWLREFERIGEVKLLSSDDFSKHINNPDYPRAFSYILPEVVADYPDGYWPDESQFRGLEFHDFSYIFLDGKEAGFVNLTDAELVYYYRFLQRDDEKPPVPMFLLGGKGSINYRGEEPQEILAKVLANAISFEHVKGDLSK